jgi:hypothetical protein
MFRAVVRAGSGLGGSSGFLIHESRLELRVIRAILAWLLEAP